MKTSEFALFGLSPLVLLVALLPSTFAKSKYDEKDTFYQAIFTGDAERVRSILEGNKGKKRKKLLGYGILPISRYKNLLPANTRVSMSTSISAVSACLIAESPEPLKIVLEYDPPLSGLKGNFNIGIMVTDEMQLLQYGDAMCGAAILNNVEAAKILYKHGLKFDQELQVHPMLKGTDPKPYKGKDAAYYAAENGSIETMDFFVDNGFNINKAYDGGLLDGNIIHAAAFKGHADFVKHFIQKGASIDRLENRPSSAASLAQMLAEISIEEDPEKAISLYEEAAELYALAARSYQIHKGRKANRQMLLRGLYNALGQYPQNRASWEANNALMALEKSRNIGKPEQGEAAPINYQGLFFYPFSAFCSSEYDIYDFRTAQAEVGEGLCRRIAKNARELGSDNLIEVVNEAYKYRGYFTE